MCGRNMVWYSLSPRPKTNPSVDCFQYRALYWKRYTHWMRSGDETRYGRAWVQPCSQACLGMRLICGDIQHHSKAGQHVSLGMRLVRSMDMRGVWMLCSYRLERW